MLPADRRALARGTIAPIDATIVERMWRAFGVGELWEIRRLPGRSNRTFECVSPRGPRLIVRLADPVGARFAMEAAVLQRCAASGVATVPTVLHVGVEDVPDGPNSVAVMVQEQLPGLTLGEFSAERDLTEAHATTARAGEILAAVHAVRTEGFGPLDAELRGPAQQLGAWFIDSLEPKIRGAREVDPEAGPLIDQSFALIASHRALLDASAPGLLHGDFSPANLLVRESGEIAGVIDWEAAKSGPPEMDIGWWDCFSNTLATPTEQLLTGYERLVSFESARLAALRHLTVIRVMIGHFTWTLSVGDRSGIRTAADRLLREVDGADEWRLV
jgi:aminoglycoside phosphotransferase (APT) family kinase protein